MPECAGSKYVGSVLAALDGVQSKSEQTLDAYGNVTESKQYEYGNLSTPARTYTNTFVTNTAYTSRFIRGKLLTSSVTGGGQTVTLASNTYDGTAIQSQPVVREWVNPGTTVRGNLTKSITPGAVRNMTFDYVGNVIKTDDGQNHDVTVTPGNNAAAPAAITGGGLSMSMSYNAFLGLTQETGSNGETAAIGYDTVGRPVSSTSPNGAGTTYVYTNSPPTTKATTNGRWTKTTFDGLGRAVKLETGDASSTKSIVETEYDSCACTPVGKVKRVSLPYAPGGTVYWTTNTYDGLGRTTQVTLPGGTGTSTYTYAGNLVTKTDPAGRWKKYTTDAMGNLVKVTEPNPAGGADLDTTYAYNVLHKLTTVTMTRGGVTQTRTFVYNSDQRLQSVTNPETGTTTFEYNADGTMLKKTDGKNQKTQYAYDTKQRVTAVMKFATGSSTEDTCQHVDYAYDTNVMEPSFGQNLQGRVATVSYSMCGSAFTSLTEMYSYSPSGQMTKKRLRRIGSETLDQDQLAAYDNEGRIVAKDSYSYLYDTMGRASGLRWNTVDGNNNPLTLDVVKDVLYGPAGEMTQLKRGFLGSSGSSFWGQTYTETRSYNVRVQLTRHTVVSSAGGAPGMDLEYRYSGTANDGKLTQSKDWVTGEELTYQYDTLGRLISAATTGPEWGLSFGYDGFGNRTSQAVTKGAAPTSYLNYDGNNRITTGGFGYDANGNMTQMPGVTGTMTYDVANRLKGAAGETYGYGADNRRVWRKTAGGDELFTFWGVDGHRVEEMWFGGMQLGTGDGKMVFTDRVGSVRLRVEQANWWNWERHGYYPYGEEKTATAGNRAKFGTYTRDQATGLDYADQRYYSSTTGRFLTPDPYESSAGLGDPPSWNRYTYVQGDPINFNDPSGQMMASVEGGGGGGGVFIIPGLIFSVWKWLFGGAPKNPVVEAWKTNPGAQVAAWDRKIGDAREDGEEQDKRYIAALKVVGDCYTRSPFGGTWIRRFTYQPIDEEGQRFARGEYSVTEQNVVVQGGSLIGQATWGPAQQNTNGTFSDYVGKLNPSADDIVQYQTFTATMLNSAGFMPGVARPVMITYPGYGSQNFGTWGHWMTNGGVRTNNYWYHPGTGRQICDDEPVMRFR